MNSATFSERLNVSLDCRHTLQQIQEKGSLLLDARSGGGGQECQVEERLLSRNRNIEYLKV